MSDHSALTSALLGTLALGVLPVEASAAMPRITGIYGGGDFIPGTSQYDDKATIFDFQLPSAGGPQGTITATNKVELDESSSLYRGFTHDRSGNLHLLSIPLTSATAITSLVKALSISMQPAPGSIDFVSVTPVEQIGGDYLDFELEYDPKYDSFVVAYPHTDNMLRVYRSASSVRKNFGYSNNSYQDIAFDGHGNLVAISQSLEKIELTKLIPKFNEYIGIYYDQESVLTIDIPVLGGRNPQVKIDIDFDTGLYYILATEFATSQNNSSYLLEYNPDTEILRDLGRLADLPVQFRGFAVVAASQVPEPGLFASTCLIGGALALRRIRLA